MERETLTALLLLILGGLTLQFGAARTSVEPGNADDWLAERMSWRQLWLPLLPASWIGTCLLGWALAEPDPVRDRMNPVVVVLLAVPFMMIVGRALIRALVSLLKHPTQTRIHTYGLWRPRLYCDAALQSRWTPTEWLATYLHEYAHRRHRDPLRVWLAQIAVDVQWPWPDAQQRFLAWLECLEQLRDLEAVTLGADPMDLATAILKTVRYQQELGRTLQVPILMGARVALTRPDVLLRQRINHLLRAQCTPFKNTPTPRIHWGFEILMMTGLWVSGLVVGLFLAAPMVAWLLRWTL